ncbi:Gfo/Idh/MocA family protein [Dactylosporangium sp. NPDC000521]|uniref:Gfo/Idh/MocA family protein n=1 Tax=Dactylosporangium sp. NPDC000521 TaxID=3363975 RepID=UPI0036A85714
MSRWLIVGYGRAGEVHAAALSRVPSAVIAGVVDSLPQTREKASAAGYAVYGDLEAAIERERPDALSVALPHDLHEWTVEVAAANGLAVLVEKPLARDAEEADRMVSTAKAAGVELGCLMNYRAYAQLRWVRQVIADGTLRVRSAVVEVNLPAPVQVPGWQSNRARAGGGLLRTVGVHYLDLLVWWLGLPERLVGHVTGPSDEVASALIALPGEVSATVSVAAVAARGAGVRMTLFADQGNVVIEGSQVVSYPVGMIPPEPEADGADLLYGAGHLEYFRAADRAVGLGDPFPVRGDEGLAAVRLVDLWYTSARTGGWVALDT